MAVRDTTSRTSHNDAKVGKPNLLPLQAPLRPLRSQHYDRSVAIGVQNTMAVRDKLQNRYDRSSAQTTMRSWNVTVKGALVAEEQQALRVRIQASNGINILGKSEVGQRPVRRTVRRE